MRTKDSHVGVVYGEVIVEAMEGGCVGKACEEYPAFGEREEAKEGSRREKRELRAGAKSGRCRILRRREESFRNKVVIRPR